MTRNATGLIRFRSIRDTMASMLLRTIALALTCLFLACQQPQKPEESAPVELDSEASAALERLSDEFRREVYEVTDGVYQAVGFGIANSIMVEGEECVFIVDVMGSMETAADVKAEFGKITQKPVGALIYTHNHADHVMGGLAFAPDGKVDVYAHDTTNYYINRMANVLRPVLRRRSARMFGSYLRTPGPDRMENVGLGPFVETLDPDMTLGLIRPNKTFSDQLETEICGVKTELVHAPGETNDQLFVWLPERGVLLPGDNIYKAFPNLYSIRGTLYRDVLAWAYSIDKMRALRPTHLVPSHTRAISGDPVRARPNDSRHQSGSHAGRAGRGREAPAAPGGAPVPAGGLREGRVVRAWCIQWLPRLVRRRRGRIGARESRSASGRHGISGGRRRGLGARRAWSG